MARVYTNGFEMGDMMDFINADHWRAGTLAARTGTYSLEFYHPGGAGQVQLWLPTALPSEFYFHMSVRARQNSPLFYFMNAALTHIIDLDVFGPTTIRYLCNGSYTTVTLPFVQDSSIWYVFDVYIKIADAGGRIVVKIDGVTVIDFTGDTKPAGDTTIAAIGFQGITGQNWNGDDLAINDTTGVVDNGWINDIRIVAQEVDGNGDTNEYTPSAGSNYQNVDETPANDDTDYNEDSTAGHRDMYTVGDFDASGGKTITRVWAEARCRDTVAAGGKVRLGVKTHGTVYLSSDISLLTSYTTRNIGSDLTNNPNTGNPWTDAEADAVQFVVETE